MFRKEVDQNQSVKYSSDYPSVVQFIRLNKVIPHRLLEMADNGGELFKIGCLREIIHSGDFTHSIFKEGDCQLYSLYLLQEEQITLEQFLTINIYLFLQMVHGERSLRVEDEGLKRPIQFSTTKIDSPKISDLFLSKLDSDHYQQFTGKSISHEVKSQLRERFNEFDEFNKTVFVLSKFKNDKKDDVLEQTKRYMLSPFLAEDAYNYYIPSVAIINLFLSTINPHPPVKMAPIFGRIGLPTLLSLHDQGYHPIALYSKDVASNPKLIHDKHCGPVAALLHDLGGHLYFANLLQKNEHAFIFKYLLPKIKEYFNVSENDINPSSEFFNVLDFNFSSNQKRVISKDNLLFYCIDSLLNFDRSKDPLNDEEIYEPFFNFLIQNKKTIDENYQINIEQTLFALYAFNAKSTPELK